MRWADPPRSWAIFDDDTLTQLRSRPGEWAIIREYETVMGRANPKHPRDIEVKWVAAKKRHYLYARALAPST